MTVNCQYTNQPFTAERVLWTNRELVDAIVRAALAGQTQAFLDMIIETERPEDITRVGVNQTLQGVKDNTSEFIKDVVNDLRRALEERLASANYSAAVTGIKYDLDGDVKDIEVDVRVDWARD